MVIGTVEEIESLKETILINAQKTVEQLSVKIASLPAMSFLAEVKFDGVGIDPLKGTELNKAFADCIQMILDEYGIDIPNRRRKFDLFLWYANRKKQIL